MIWNLKQLQFLLNLATAICPEQVSFNTDHHHTLIKCFCNAHFDISSTHHDVLCTLRYWNIVLRLPFCVSSIIIFHLLIYLDLLLSIILLIIFTSVQWPWGHAVAQLVGALRFKRKVAGSMSKGALRFFIDIILPAAPCPCGQLKLNHKWVSLWGGLVKAAGV